MLKCHGEKKVVAVKKNVMYVWDDILSSQAYSQKVRRLDEPNSISLEGTKLSYRGNEATYEHEGAFTCYEMANKTIFVGTDKGSLLIFDELLDLKDILDISDYPIKQILFDA